MARISTYPVDQNITGTDKVIGSDFTGQITKNYTLDGIAGWMNESGSVSIAGQNNYSFEVPDKTIGTITGPAANATFASINALQFSKTSTLGVDVTGYLLTLVGRSVILARLDNPNNFGVYVLNSLTVDGIDDNYYNAVLTLTVANGNIASNKYYGFAGYTANTGTTTAANTQTFTNKSGSNLQWTNDAGYTTNTGDITGVTAGTGMSGGGISGTVTLNCTIDTPSEVGLGNLSSSGNALAGSFTATGDITAYSDKRLKTNIETISGALEKVNALRGVTFDKDGKRGLGVIAQEVEKILPEVVLDGEEYKSVAYGNIVGVLIEAVKEQQKQINELKERLDGFTK
jgi:hypothetical protein